MIFTVQFSIRIDNEFAPYQEDEVYDLMDRIGLNKGFLGWSMVKIEREEDDEVENEGENLCGDCIHCEMIQHHGTPIGRCKLKQIV